MCYYQSKKDEMEEIDKLTELGESYPIRGFDNIYYFLFKKKVYSKKILILIKE
jgi:hypothetical protein